MLTVHPSHAARVLIDGALVELEIRRLTRAETSAYQRRFDRVHTSEAARRVLVRQPGEEQEKQPRVRARTQAQIAAAEALARFDERYPIDGRVQLADDVALAVVHACRALVPEESTDEEFVIPDAEIRRRRLEEMSADARAAWEALDAAEDTERDKFYDEVVTSYVRAKPDQIGELVDGELREVTEGADLVRIYGARLDVMRQLVDAVGIENTVPAPVKKAWWSRFDSVGSSSEPATEVAGKTPATTAAGAGPEGSATSAAATASPAIG